jgi:peptidoglycan/LPS O-acetylase OafA/YrhL
MWFLGYLFLYFLIVASFWKYKPYLLAGSITFLFATQFGGVTDLNKFIYLFTFFMFGALVSSNIMALAMKIHPALEVIACVVLFSFVACLVNADLLGSKYELFALPIGIMAVMAMILLAGIIAQTGGAPCRLLIFFGTMSLEVYLLHWTIINVICLRLPGIVAEQHGDLVVLYVFSASLAATILSVWGARLLKLDFLFALPKRAEGRLAQPRTAEV